MQDRRKFLLELAQDALRDIEKRDVSLSAVLRKCQRIAYLRGDWFNYIRLSMETIDLQNEKQRLQLQARLTTYFPDHAKALWKSWLEEYIEERTAGPFDEDSGQEATVFTQGVAVLEVRIAELQREIQDIVAPAGLHPVDLYYVEQRRARARTQLRLVIIAWQSILKNIQEKVYQFLIRTEQELLFGNVHLDIFEQNLRYVEQKLGKIAPEALRQFVAAFYEASSYEPESMAKALVSARRLLKTLANFVYPPRKDVVRGIDGKERRLGEEQYLARLWQFISEACSKTSGKLLAVQIQDLGHRIDYIYSLINKGIHDNVDSFEFNQVLIQTFLVVGDILRLSEVSIEGQNDGL